MGELDRMEKEHTLWDWFSDGLGSSVLCEEKMQIIKVMKGLQYYKRSCQKLSYKGTFPTERRTGQVDKGACSTVNNTGCLR
jgi:hypothetical protein